jgi:hypothetical protein
VPDTSPFDRGNYIKTLSSYSLRQTITVFASAHYLNRKAIPAERLNVTVMGISGIK